MCFCKRVLFLPSWFYKSWWSTYPVIKHGWKIPYPIGSMYGIYANIWGILMVNVSIYTIHGSYGYVIVYGKKNDNPWKCLVFFQLATFHFRRVAPKIFPRTPRPPDLFWPKTTRTAAMAATHGISPGGSKGRLEGTWTYHIMIWWTIIIDIYIYIMMLV